MKMNFRSLFPAMLLAAGVLAATAVSLSSSRSLAWALAGPAILMATILAAGAMEDRVVSVRTMILGGAVFVAGAIVGFTDPSSVPAMMPILGTCGVAVLAPRRCIAHGTFENR